MDKNCKTQVNLDFFKKGKTVNYRYSIGADFKFSKSQMRKRTSPLDSSREI